MPPLASIELQVRKFFRQCVSAFAGLVFATAVAASGSVTLTWDPVVHPLLSGYAVYVGSAPGHYDVRYEVGDVTSYQLVGLEEGRRYHFAVTAYAVLYGESEFSNDVGTTIPYRAPVVDFSASATMGTAPLALNFVATVQGTATSYLWTFGDGSTSTASNPVHVYEAPGVYSVSLAVMGPGGTASSTRIGYVTVAPAGAASGGMLAGALTPMPASIDLTSAGTIDWVHWQGNARKAGVAPQISGLTLVGRGATAIPTTEPGALRWSDGVPVAAGSVNDAVSVSGTGRGFRFTAPADQTPRKLTLFVGTTNANGRLVAHLSDNSASEFANMPVRKLGSRWSGVYTLTYHAASPGQTLEVEWIQARGISSPGKPAPGVSIQGAALSLVP
jgi:PKD repeat protein